MIESYEILKQMLHDAIIGGEDYHRIRYIECFDDSPRRLIPLPASVLPSCAASIFHASVQESASIGGGGAKGGMALPGEPPAVVGPLIGD